MGAEENRRTVAEALAAWADDDGEAFLALLGPDTPWTITGSSSVAGTYRGAAELHEAVLQHLRARLRTPLVPAVRSLVADGDQVVVRWDGRATALDGEPYENSYSWHLTMADGQITEVVAFLDTQALEALLARVDPPG